MPDGRFYSTVLCMPPLCSSVCLRILSLARCRGGRLSCRRVRAPPSGVPGRPPSPPPPCAHVIGLRGRRWPRSPPRGFARRCQRIFVAGQDSPPEYNCSTVRYLRIANGRRGTSCRFELLWLDLRCPVPPRLTSRGLIAILPCGVAQCITQCTTFVPVATSWCASRAQFASACSPPCACPCTQTDGRLRDACVLQQGC